MQYYKSLIILILFLLFGLESASSGVEIYAFDQNPAGRDEGNEWDTLYNPTNESVDIGNWVLETADGERETIPKGTILYTGAYYDYTHLISGLITAMKR